MTYHVNKAPKTVIDLFKETLKCWPFRQPSSQPHLMSVHPHKKRNTFFRAESKKSAYRKNTDCFLKLKNVGSEI